MTDQLETRLNQIPQKITSEGFLRGEGNGNEIAFHIFDYPPSAEERLRAYTTFLEGHLAKTHPNLRVRWINLFEFVIQALDRRSFLQKSYDMQKKDGDASLIKRLRGQFEGTKIAEAFVAEVTPDEQDLVIVTGVGSAFPVVRAHSLLAALQPKMNRTPLLMFYPGGLRWALCPPLRQGSQ